MMKNKAPKGKESKPDPNTIVDIHTLDSPHSSSFCNEYYIVAMPKDESQPNYTEVSRFLSMSGNYRPVGVLTLGHYVASKIASIDTMDVDPQYQGRGIGRLLLARAKVFAKERGAETLHTNSIYDAVGFYKKQGMIAESPNPNCLSMSLIDNDCDDM